MGHRAHAALRGRPYATDPTGRDARNRNLIAQSAARLIAQHGITDWSLAKRKAVRELMLPEREALPGDDEVEAALVDYQALFGGDAHRAQLRRQREEALLWLTRLARFTPVLVGGVAKGWATQWSDIRIELEADDAKAVEFTLLNLGVAFRAMHAEHDGLSDLFFATPRGGVRLAIRSTAEVFGRNRRDRHGNPEVRLDAEALAGLLATPT